MCYLSRDPLLRALHVPANISTWWALHLDLGELCVKKFNIVCGLTLPAISRFLCINRLHAVEEGEERRAYIFALP
jgi:hypothetical protein